MTNYYVFKYDSGDDIISYDGVKTSAPTNYLFYINDDDSVLTINKNSIKLKKHSAYYLSLDDGNFHVSVTYKSVLSKSYYNFSIYNKISGKYYWGIISDNQISDTTSTILSYIHPLTIQCDSNNYDLYIGEETSPRNINQKIFSFSFTFGNPNLIINNISSNLFGTDDFNKVVIIKVNNNYDFQNNNYPTILSFLINSDGTASGGYLGNVIGSIYGPNGVALNNDMSNVVFTNISTIGVQSNGQNNGSIIIAGVPNGAKIKVDGAEYTSNGNTITINNLTLSSHIIEFLAFNNSTVPSSRTIVLSSTETSKTISVLYTAGNSEGPDPQPTDITPIPLSSSSKFSGSNYFDVEITIPNSDMDCWFEFNHDGMIQINAYLSVLTGYLGYECKDLIKIGSCKTPSITYDTTSGDFILGFNNSFKYNLLHNAYLNSIEGERNSVIDYINSTSSDTTELTVDLKNYNNIIKNDKFRFLNSYQSYSNYKSSLDSYYDKTYRNINNNFYVEEVNEQENKIKISPKVYGDLNKKSSIVKFFTKYITTYNNGVYDYSVIGTEGSTSFSDVADKSATNRFLGVKLSSASDYKEYPIIENTNKKIIVKGNVLVDLINDNGVTISDLANESLSYQIDAYVSGDPFIIYKDVFYAHCDDLFVFFRTDNNVSGVNKVKVIESLNQDYYSEEDMYENTSSLNNINLNVPYLYSIVPSSSPTTTVGSKLIILASGNEKASALQKDEYSYFVTGVYLINGKYYETQRSNEITFNLLDNNNVVVCLVFDTGLEEKYVDNIFGFRIYRKSTLDDYQLLSQVVPNLRCLYNLNSNSLTNKVVLTKKKINENSSKSRKISSWNDFGPREFAVKEISNPFYSITYYPDYTPTVSSVDNAGYFNPSSSSDSVSYRFRGCTILNGHILESDKTQADSPPLGSDGIDIEFTYSISNYNSLLKFEPKNTGSSGTFIYRKNPGESEYYLINSYFGGTYAVYDPGVNKYNYEYVSKRVFPDDEKLISYDDNNQSFEALSYPISNNNSHIVLYDYLSKLKNQSYYTKSDLKYIKYRLKDSSDIKNIDLYYLIYANNKLKNYTLQYSYGYGYGFGLGSDYFDLLDNDIFETFYGYGIPSLEVGEGYFYGYGYSFGIVPEELSIGNRVISSSIFRFNKNNKENIIKFDFNPPKGNVSYTSTSSNKIENITIDYSDLLIKNNNIDNIQFTNHKIGYGEFSGLSGYYEYDEEFTYNNFYTNLEHDFNGYKNWVLGFNVDVKIKPETGNEDIEVNNKFFIKYIDIPIENITNLDNINSSIFNPLSSCFFNKYGFEILGKKCYLGDISKNNFNQELTVLGLFNNDGLKLRLKYDELNSASSTSLLQSDQITEIKNYLKITDNNYINVNIGNISQTISPDHIGLFQFLIDDDNGVPDIYYHFINYDSIDFGEKDSSIYTYKIGEKRRRSSENDNLQLIEFDGINNLKIKFFGYLYFPYATKYRLYFDKHMNVSGNIGKKVDEYYHSLINNNIAFFNYSISQVSTSTDNISKQQFSNIEYACDSVGWIPIDFKMSKINTNCRGFYLALESDVINYSWGKYFKINQVGSDNSVTFYSISNQYIKDDELKDLVCMLNISNPLTGYDLESSEKQYIETNYSSDNKTDKVYIYSIKNSKNRGMCSVDENHFNLVQISKNKYDLNFIKSYNYVFSMASAAETIQWYSALDKTKVKLTSGNFSALNLDSYHYIIKLTDAELISLGKSSSEYYSTYSSNLNNYLKNATEYYHVIGKGPSSSYLQLDKEISTLTSARNWEYIIISDNTINLDYDLVDYNSSLKINENGIPFDSQVCKWVLSIESNTSNEIIFKSPITYLDSIVEYENDDTNSRCVLKTNGLNGVNVNVVNIIGNPISINYLETTPIVRQILKVNPNGDIIINGTLTTDYIINNFRIGDVSDICQSGDMFWVNIYVPKQVVTSEITRKHAFLITCKIVDLNNQEYVRQINVPSNYNIGSTIDDNSIYDNGFIVYNPNIDNSYSYVSNDRKSFDAYLFEKAYGIYESDVIVMGSEFQMWKSIIIDGEYYLPEDIKIEVKTGTTLDLSDITYNIDAYGVEYDPYIMDGSTTTIDIQRYTTNGSMENGEVIINRYLQFRITLTSKKMDFTPKINSVTIDYSSKNSVLLLTKNIELSSNIVRGILTYNASEPDGTEIIFGINTEGRRDFNNFMRIYKDEVFIIPEELRNNNFILGCSLVSSDTDVPKLYSIALQFETDDGEDLLNIEF